MSLRSSRLLLALAGLSAVLALYLVGVLVVWLMRGSPGEPRPATNGNPVLSGTRPVDARALARLARQRAGLGAAWLAGVGRPDGSFHYWYYPTEDRFSSQDYSSTRHAGVTYSLFQVYDAVRDSRVLAAGERGAGWIERHSPRAPDGSGRAFVERGTTKLGSQALALVALLERRRVTGRRDRDALIRRMAAFLQSLEVPGQPGRYFQSYRPGGNRRSLEPSSDYYPPEALLAYTRLAQHFPGGPYLRDARRLADYLVAKRPGTVPAKVADVSENQWIALSMSELYRLAPDPRYRRAAYLQAESMRANQFTAADDRPESIGASRARVPINYTSSATKAEALVAVWALARHAGDAAGVRRFSQAALRNVQFQMRVQYTRANTRRFPRPARAVGAWPQDPVVANVRMDFVQHNISALITAWRMQGRGDLALEGGSGGAPRR